MPNSLQTAGATANWEPPVTADAGPFYGNKTTKELGHLWTAALNELAQCQSEAREFEERKLGCVYHDTELRFYMRTIEAEIASRSEQANGQ